MHVFSYDCVLIPGTPSMVWLPIWQRVDLIGPDDVAWFQLAWLARNSELRLHMCTLIAHVVFFAYRALFLTYIGAKAGSKGRSVTMLSADELSKS